MILKRRNKRTNYTGKRIMKQEVCTFWYSFLDGEQSVSVPPNYDNNYVFAGHFIVVYNNMIL